MEDEIINRVAGSALITFNLEDYYHSGERLIFDIKDLLYQELLLREKDFRDFIRNHDWSQYQGKNVGIVCTSEAIVPTWAYMLLATKLEPFVNKVIYGDLEKLEQALYQQALVKIDPETYRNAKIVIKGCGNLPVPVFAYVEISSILTPVAHSIMYGEPCSTVPIFKNNKK
ncbi:MAG TPA: DUF2480 family protein [Cytophagaceae bacterium]|jgi:hypothetical protein|nr:DUF2480 family protein [Cytophagaceae bacterium]